MGLFDSIKNTANQFGNFSNSVQRGINNMSGSGGFGNKSVDVTFARLPQSLAEFTSLPQAALANPFDTAAMAVLAFCFYPQNSALCLDMVNYLRGPRPLSEYDKQFIKDRFRDKDYVPRSYFNGATPQNDYMPSQPYTVRVSENPYSYQNENYAKLFVHSGGADSPRELLMRLAKDGKWYLWEQFILSDIRRPESANPWA